MIRTHWNHRIFSSSLKIEMTVSNALPELFATYWNWHKEGKSWQHEDQTAALTSFSILGGTGSMAGTVPRTGFKEIRVKLIPRLKDQDDADLTTVWQVSWWLWELIVLFCMQPPACASWSSLGSCLLISNWETVWGTHPPSPQVFRIQHLSYPTNPVSQTLSFEQWAAKPEFGSSSGFWEYY